MMPDTPTGRIVRKVDSMGKALSVLAVVLALAGLVAAVGVATWINSPAQQQAISQRAASDAAKAAADLQAQQALAALDLQASQQSAARWAVFWDVVTPLAWLVLAVLALCVVVGVPAGLGIWLAMQWDERRKRRVVYYADARGLLPVTPAALDTAATVALAGHRFDFQGWQRCGRQRPQPHRRSLWCSPGRTRQRGGCLERLAQGGIKRLDPVRCRHIRCRRVATTTTTAASGRQQCHTCTAHPLHRLSKFHGYAVLNPFG